MTYRDDADEIATLRQELAVSEAACATAMAEVEALKADVKVLLGHLNDGIHQLGVTQFDNYRLEKERDEARAERDSLRHVEADLDRLRTAVRSVLAMVDHGTALPALMHAVVQLRRFVDPEVGT